MRHKIKKFIIFLNGTYASSHVRVLCHNTCSTTIDKIKNENLYAADGGLNYIIKHNLNSQKIMYIGDNDSLSRKSKKFLDKKNLNINNYNSKTDYIEFKTLNKDKCFSDFAAILDLILKDNLKNQVFIEIFYGLGGRKDHEMANLLEAEKFLLNLPQGGLCYFHGGVILSTIACKIYPEKNLNFSVFSKYKKCEIEISGAKYEGHILLERPSHGLSNQSTAKEVIFKPIGSLITIYF